MTHEGHRGVSDSRHLEAAMLRSVESLVRLVGWQEHDIPGELAPEQLPACVLAACENAINFLAVGASVLDPDGPILDTDIDADEALARFTEAKP